MIHYQDWGLIDYKEAWGQQIALFDRTVADKMAGRRGANTLVFCEHPHVITIGKSGDKANLLFDAVSLQEKGVSYYEIDRGGDVTYHGPGQIVGYPIFDLEQFNLGLKQYIHLLEESIIQLLAEYGIEATRLPSATGVWLEVNTPRARKICAIGVRSSRYVTMHGFALNINTDLSYFSLIHPCGFVDKGVTSLAKELGRTLDFEAVKSRLEEIIRKLFSELNPA